jgi:integrase
MPKIAIEENSLRINIGEAKANGKPVYLWDTREKGFGCYISKSGQVSFLFQHWSGGHNGKATRIVIGDARSLTIDKARTEVAKLKDKKASGEEVLSAHKARIAKEKEENAAKPVRVYFEEYFNERNDNSRYWNEVLRLYKLDVLPAIGDTKIGKVTSDDIHKIIRSRKAVPTTARYIYTFLMPFFTWAIDQRYIKVTPMAGIKRPKPAQSRDRVLNEHEIIEFWRSCDELAYPFGPMFKLLLLTGQRRNEVSGLLWKEIDTTRREWTVPKARSKNKKAHLVHLSPQAMEVLESLPRLNSEFVFTTTVDTPASGYGTVKVRLDRLMASELGKELEPWRLHDLRRSAASIMRGLRIHKDTIELVLNHTSGERGGLVGTYQRHELIDERKEAVILLGRYVEGLVEGSANNVIEFKRA